MEEWETVAGGGHTAIVTGANHGIGAATAVELGRRGCAVLCTFLRFADEPDSGVTQAYRDGRAADAAAVVEQILAGGGRGGGGGRPVGHDRASQLVRCR